MEGAGLLQRIINAYSKKNNNWKIDYSQLLSFINSLVLNDESGRYGVFSTNTSDVLTAMLIDLEEKGVFELEYDQGIIRKIYNFSYLNVAIKDAYQNMESGSDHPFPSQASLAIDLPDEKTRTLYLPNDLSFALKDKNEARELAYKLVFSNDSSPIVAEGEVLRSRGLVLAVSKIRNYLAHKNNANYAYQKLLPSSKQNTRALVETIKMVQSNPGRAATAIKKPDEFLFSFWTQLCSFLIKEFSSKENKTSFDEAILQSVHLINAYILHYKNIILKNKRRDEALKYVGERIKKEPYYFTITDIYSFKDKTGILLDKKYSRENLHDFISSKTELKEKEILPELIKLKTVNNKLYYIHRGAFLTLVHKKIGDAHDFYRKQYLDQWIKDLKNYKNPPEMKNDELFEKSLEKNIRKEDPLLYSLLAYELLFLAVNSSKNLKLKAVAQGWIDPKLKSTRPLSIILNLQRRALASEVSAIVPFWLTIGFFRKIAALFGGRRRKKKTSAKKKNPVNNIASDRVHSPNTSTSGNSSAGNTKSTQYKKNVDILRKQFDYSTSTVFQRLDELSNKWNPLLDGEARKNLEKDVNNMVRDYMRKILRETAFAVPDKERVENIADLLSSNKAFKIIKKQKAFKDYIITYIIKTLTETKP